VETIVERAAGLDVHKAQVTACARVPGRGRERAQEVAEFQTTVRGLLSLRDWLKAHRVTQVAMEATGVYWKPVWAILEDEFDCLLVNAGAGPQDRRLRRGLALPTVGGGAVGTQFRAAEADPGDAQSDPLPQGADRRAPARG